MLSLLRDKRPSPSFRPLRYGLIVLAVGPLLLGACGTTAQTYGLPKPGQGYLYSNSIRVLWVELSQAGNHISGHLTSVSAHGASGLDSGSTVQANEIVGSRSGNVIWAHVITGSDTPSSHASLVKMKIGPSTLTVYSYGPGSSPGQVDVVLRKSSVGSFRSERTALEKRAQSTPAIPLG